MTYPKFSNINGDVIYVNPYHIVAINDGRNGAVIHLTDKEAIPVRESLIEVILALNSCSMETRPTIKEKLTLLHYEEPDREYLNGANPKNQTINLISRISTYDVHHVDFETSGEKLLRDIGILQNMPGGHFRLLGIVACSRELPRGTLLQFYGENGVLLGEILE